MKYPPWAHQQRGYDQIEEALKEHRAVLYVLATRGGKSWVAARLIEERPDQTIYFVAHTRILITQMSDELTAHGIYHGIIAPWAPRIRCNVQVISKDTLLPRMAQMKRSGWNEPAQIIIDECHLSKGAGYVRLIKQYPDAQLVGLTGSPCRSDNSPLGDVFDHMVVGPSHRELQMANRLCPIDTYGVDFAFPDPPASVIDTEAEAEYTNKPFILRGIVDKWEHMASGKQTLVFCSSIAHAESMAGAFEEAGHPAIALSSNNQDDEIDAGLAAFYDGSVKVVCSVNLFLMGLTVKDCECVIQARRTNSLMIYLQSTGRGMMYVPGKRLVNIDAVNNHERHGLPDDDRAWSLDHAPVRETYASRLKRCPHCYRMPARSASVCFYCGHEFTENDGTGRMPKEADGNLVLLQRQAVADVIRDHGYSVVQARGIAGVMVGDPDVGEVIFNELMIALSGVG